MAKLAKPLPEQDIHALFDVVVVLLGELVGGQVPAELTAMMIRRLAKDGFLDQEASAGELGAVVGDLSNGCTTRWVHTTACPSHRRGRRRTAC
jgi:hypothetical protein